MVQHKSLGWNYNLKMALLQPEWLSHNFLLTGRNLEQDMGGTLLVMAGWV